MPQFITKASIWGMNGLRVSEVRDLPTCGTRQGGPLASTETGTAF